jgi:hypothetical protein
MEYEWEIDGLSYFIAMESMEYNRLDIWNIMEYEWNIM